MNPIAVAFARTEPGDVSMPHEGGHFFQLDAGLALVIEETELNGLCLLGEQREVDAGTVPGGTQGRRRSGPYLHRPADYPAPLGGRCGAGVTLRAMSKDVAEDTLKRLLDLQAEDSEIRRLNDRIASLPEAARLEELKTQLAELEADLAIAGKQLGEIEREQARLEGEIELLEGKLTKEEQRLFAGSVSNPKELAALQSEVEMLKRKRSGLEDGLLEVMEQREGAAATEEGLRAEREGVGADAERLSATVNELTAELEAGLSTHTQARIAIASEIPEDLASLYEKTRAAKHGVGAAALVGSTCQGCHTELPAREVERLRSERGLQRCDNCRRILVVT